MTARSRFTPPLFVLVIVAATLAGCGSKGGPVGPTEGPPADPFEAIKDMAKGLPCQATVPPTGSSANFKQLNRSAHSGGTHAELDIHGDWAVIARYSDGGFDVVNLTDPLHPERASTFSDAPGGLDVKFSPDNMTAFVGSGGGITIADIRDPYNVTKEGEWLFPQVPGSVAFENAHMFSTALIAGKQWLFLAPNSNTGIWVLEIVGEPGKRTLELRAQTLPIQGGPLGPHDLFIVQDTKTHQWLLYSADGFHGWTVFDMADPTKPKIVGGWTAAESGYTHTIQAAWVGERRLVVSIQEVGVNFLKVWDATNLQAPIVLGAWQASTGAGSAAAEHNFQFVDGKVYLAHYSYGVYVLDMGTVGSSPALLKEIGRYAPASNENGGYGSIWDVVINEGLVYVSDQSKGLHIVAFGCLSPGDVRQTSLG